MSWFSISCREGIRACPLKPWDGRTCGRVRRSLDSRVQGMVLALSRCPAFRVQGFLSSRNQLHSWPTSILQHCHDSWQVSLKFNALYCQIRLTLSGLHPLRLQPGHLGDERRWWERRYMTWKASFPWCSSILSCCGAIQTPSFDPTSPKTQAYAGSHSMKPIPNVNKRSVDKPKAVWIHIGIKFYRRKNCNYVKYVATWMIQNETHF